MIKPTLAFSVRQPWAWLIVAGLKDVENRSRNLRRFGPVFVHAGLYRPTEWELLQIEIKHGVKIDPTTLHFGGLIGTVRLTGCVDSHPSKWFAGPVGWTLANARTIPFRPCKGALGLFRPAPG